MQTHKNLNLLQQKQEREMIRYFVAKEKIGQSIVQHALGFCLHVQMLLKQ